MLLHAAAAGKVALDSIHADTADVAGAKAEAVDAAVSGFAATVSIHPGLVPAIRQAYAPSEEQLEWAARVIGGASSNSGAFAVDGQMIDAPLLRQAEVIHRRGKPNPAPALRTTAPPRRETTTLIPRQGGHHD